MHHQIGKSANEAFSLQSYSVVVVLLIPQLLALKQFLQMKLGPPKDSFVLVVMISRTELEECSDSMTIGDVVKVSQCSVLAQHNIRQRSY